MEAKTSPNKFLRILTIPIRALSKARDLYVKSMNGYAAKGCYGGGATFGYAAAEPLPRSFSSTTVRSSASDESDDLRELIRAASARVYADKVDVAALNRPSVLQPPPQSQRKPPLPPKRKYPRSASVGMAKIEEDKACHFEEEVQKKKGGKKKDGSSSSSLFSRSRSYAEVESPTRTGF